MGAFLGCPRSWQPSYLPKPICLLGSLTDNHLIGGPIISLVAMLQETCRSVAQNGLTMRWTIPSPPTAEDSPCRPMSWHSTVGILHAGYPTGLPIMGRRPGSLFHR